MAAALHRRWLDEMGALAGLSAGDWASALAVLGPSAEGIDPDAVEARVCSAAPPLSIYARSLVMSAVSPQGVLLGDPRHETAELWASQLWSHLGGPQTAILAARLDALLNAPWVVHRAAATYNPRAVGPTPSIRRHETSAALRLLADLPDDHWAAGLSVLERSPDAPAHEVYALFARALPSLASGHTHRLLFDIIYPPPRHMRGPARQMADSLVSSFADDLEADQRLLLASRLESMISTPWIVRRLATTCGDPRT